MLKRYFQKNLKKKKPKNKFDKKTKKLIDYYTYALVSDGDLMEGISYEAASFAGNLKLGKLIVLYDSNKSTRDSNTNKTFTESVSSRFASAGWQVLYVKKGTSITEINKAIIKAKKNQNMPSIIIVNTVIGEGSKLEGNSSIYSGELTKDDYEQIKRGLGVEGLPFTLLKEPAENIRNQVVNRGTSLNDEWDKIYSEYKKEMNSNEVLEFESLIYNSINFDLTKVDFDINYEQKETLRESNSKVMNIISNSIWNFVGGNADTSSSTLAYLDGKEDISYSNFKGKNILYGVRENACGAISNGLALSGFLPFASTFMAFSDYMKPSIRMSAFMNLPVTYIFTHDSITNSFDGPTHQPVEQLASLRAMPNLYVYRPADIKEIIGSWQCIIKDKKPAVISLAKTEVKPQNGTNMLSVSKGGYIESDPDGNIDIVLIATGAEVQVANSIKERLKSEGLGVRVVSMPSMSRFEKNEESYKREILPASVKTFVIEASSSISWYKYVKNDDYLFTIDTFGASGKRDDILRKYGFTVNKITKDIEKLLK